MRQLDIYIAEKLKLNKDSIDSEIHEPMNHKECWKYIMDISDKYYFQYQEDHYWLTVYKYDSSKNCYPYIIFAYTEKEYVTDEKYRDVQKISIIDNEGRIKQNNIIIYIGYNKYIKEKYPDNLDREKNTKDLLATKYNIDCILKFLYEFEK